MSVDAETVRRIAHLARIAVAENEIEHLKGELNAMKQVTDLGAIEKVVDEIIGKNPDKVADASSNPKAIGWFVGQVMKSSGGKASPQAVNDLLKKKLGL